MTLGKKEDGEPNYAQAATKSAGGSTSSPFMANVENIIYWKDPKKSGIIFGSGVVWFYMTTLGGYTVMSFASILLLVHLVLSIISNYFVASRNPDKNPSGFEAINKAAFASNVETAVNLINEFLAWYSQLLRASKLWQAFQVMGGLLVAYIIGSWFDFYTLLFIAFLVVFSVPVVYKKNQTFFDSKFAVLEEHLRKAINDVHAKIPKAGKADDGKKST